MKTFLYAAASLVLVGLLSMSNQKGRAASGGKGSTGAPGDDATVCKSCHNGPTDVEIQIAVLDGVDTITRYEPGKNYKIHVRVNHVGGTAPKAHGFQMTLLNAPLKQDGPNLKDLSPISSNVKLTTLRSGRLYAEHTDRSDKNLFEIQWTAPAKGSGPVSIYAGGTGVNANSSESGDGGNRNAVQIDEKTASANVSSYRSGINLYPNPFSDRFCIELDPSAIQSISIHDFLGRPILEKSIHEAKTYLEIGSRQDGIYFVKFINAQGQVVNTRKLIKRGLQP